MLSAEQIRKKLGIATRNAIRRCINADDGQYEGYGARGIQVFPLWVIEPKLFVAYLATLPGHDDISTNLDRIDNDGNYEPGNLRFATNSESRSNQWRRQPEASAEVIQALTNLDCLDVRTFAIAYRQQLRCIRLNSRITQGNLGRMANCSCAQVSAMERGDAHHVSDRMLTAMLVAYAQVLKKQTEKRARSEVPSSKVRS